MFLYFLPVLLFSLHPLSSFPDHSVFREESVPPGFPEFHAYTEQPACKKPRLFHRSEADNH